MVRSWDNSPYSEGRQSVDENDIDVFDRIEEYRKFKLLPPLSLQPPPPPPQRTTFNLTYASVRGRFRWHRAKLALHRKEKSARRGAWLVEENRLLERIAVYRDLLARPVYVNAARKAANKARRVKRQPLGHRVIEVDRFSKAFGWNRERDEHLRHLRYMVYRIKLKRFKTMRHLAYVYRKPLAWLLECKAKAIAKRLITEKVWKKSFRQPGRPRKGAKRGPYKKASTPGVGVVD